MSETLWYLGEEFAAAYAALLETANEETGEIDVASLIALDDADEAFQEKAAKTGKLIRFLNNRAAELKAEENRLKEIRERLESRADSVKMYLDRCLKNAGIRKIDKFPADSVITYRKTPPKVIVDDEGKLPEIFFKIKREPDKTAIKESIASGGNVPGAHLEQTENISIK